MVVIKECFPSQKEFIADYMDKRRQRLEILRQRNFKLSFVPRGEEVLVPFECLPANVNDTIERTAVSGDLSTPRIIPLADEPVYVKNFKKFITETQQHLDRVLATNRKIDVVHGIVTEIQNPVPEPVTLVSADDFLNDDIKNAEIEDSRSASVVTSKKSLAEGSPPDLKLFDNEKMSSSVLSSKSPKSGKTSQRMTKSVRSEIDCKINPRVSRSDTKIKPVRSANDTKGKKVDWKQFNREEIRKAQKDFKTHSLDSSREKDQQPKVLLTSTERLKKFQNCIANKTPLSTRSAKTLLANRSNTSLSSRISYAKDIGEDNFSLKSSLASSAREKSYSESIASASGAKKMFKIPVSIINL